MIGRSGERGSGISVLAEHDDDDILNHLSGFQKSENFYPLFFNLASCKYVVLSNRPTHTMTLTCAFLSSY